MLPQKTNFFFKFKKTRTTIKIDRQASLGSKLKNCRRICHKNNHIFVDFLMILAKFVLPPIFVFRSSFLGFENSGKQTNSNKQIFTR